MATLTLALAFCASPEGPVTLHLVAPRWAAPSAHSDDDFLQEGSGAIQASGGLIGASVGGVAASLSSRDEEYADS